MTVQVTTRKLEGAPYSVTTIRVNGVVIRSELGILSPEAVAGYVRDYRAPTINPPPRLTASETPRPRGRPKKATVNSTGFLWTAPTEDE